MNNLRRLLIVSHVTHYQHQGVAFAYGPYAREINIWADMFTEVVIAAPVRTGIPPEDCIPFSRPNISLAGQLEAGGSSLFQKVLQLLLIPVHAYRLCRQMSAADAIQVRCPGNLGLIGVVCAPLFRVPRVAKYAGQWTTGDGEPFSWRLQKYILRSRWWKSPVLVYGNWPGEPGHVQPMFTSIMDEAQMDRARRMPARDWRKVVLNVVYVGRLSSAKNVDSVIKAIARRRRMGANMCLKIVGDGPMRSSLESLARLEGIAESVVFTGAISQEGVLGCYEQSDILILASQSEGWPKAIAEAMAFGLVCIGSNRGLVPQMLGEGRGVLVEPGDVVDLAGALEKIDNDRESANRMSINSARWGQRFTLEGLREVLTESLEALWDKRLLRNSASETCQSKPK